MLTISSLGGLSILRDGEPVTDLASRKTEALKVYVACAERPQSREVLAEMLWMERIRSATRTGQSGVTDKQGVNLFPKLA